MFKKYFNPPLCGVASSLLALTLKPFSFSSLRGNSFSVDLLLRLLGRISCRFLVRVLNSFLMRELNLKINLRPFNINKLASLESTLVRNSAQRLADGGEV